MSHLHALLQEQEDHRRRGKAILDIAKAEARDLTASEEAKLEQVEGELKKVGSQIKEAIREQEEENSMTPTAIYHPDGTVTYPGESKRTGNGRKYREMFGGSVSMDGWTSGEEFFAALHSGRFHDKLTPVYDPGKIKATATEGVMSGGGFSVPSELVATMLDRSLENEIVRPRADVQPMTSSTKKCWGFDHHDASSSVLFGAYSGGWTAETGTITDQTPEIRLITLHASKLALLTSVSNELVADGLGFEEQLQANMIKALGWFLDDAFLNGTGAGQPLGVLNDPALIPVTKQVGQPAATINYQNVIDMYSRLHPSLVQGAVWVVNPAVMPYLLVLSVAIGAGGSAVTVLREDGTGRMTLLGLPVLMSEKLPTLGTQGDVLLANFSQYTVGLRKDMSLDKSMHTGFTTDTTYYRGVLRGDGMGRWSAAYTPKAGPTSSWCVVLEDRS